MKSTYLQSLNLTAAGALLIALATGCSTSGGGGSQVAPKSDNRIPITITKLTPTPSPSAKGRRSTPRAKSIPVGNNETFTLSVDSWPSGTSSTTIRVQVFEATITQSGGLVAATTPLPVFPGSTSGSAFVPTSSTTPGSVTINIPSTLGGVSMAGKNFLLLGTKNLTTASGTFNLGGGAIFSTAP